MTDFADLPIHPRDNPPNPARNLVRRTDARTVEVLRRDGSVEQRWRLYDDRYLRVTPTGPVRVL